MISIKCSTIEVKQSLCILSGQTGLIILAFGIHFHWELQSLAHKHSMHFYSRSNNAFNTERIVKWL